MKFSPLKLSSFELDAFQEIANISACNATSCLSQLIDEKIVVLQPGTVLIPVEEIPKMVGNPEEVVFAAYMGVVGGTPGFFLIVLPQSDVLVFLGLLSHEERSEKRNLRRLEKQVMKQVATILAASYFFAMGRIVGTRIVPEDPVLFWDTREALVNEIRTIFDEAADGSFLMKTEILVSDVKTKAYLFFLPYPETYEVILTMVRYPAHKTRLKKERRIMSRVLALDLQVKYKELESTSGFQKGICGNISAGGMLLVTNQELEVDTVLLIKMESPDEELFLNLKGKIAWKNAMDVGPRRIKYGITFLDLTDEHRKALAEFTTTRIVYASFLDKLSPKS